MALGLKFWGFQWSRHSHGIPIVHQSANVAIEKLKLHQESHGSSTSINGRIWQKNESQMTDFTHHSDIEITYFTHHIGIEMTDFTTHSDIEITDLYWFYPP